MEPSTDGLAVADAVPNATEQPPLNSTWSSQDPTATLTISTLLSIMCLIGVSGNIYTLVIMYNSMRSSASMYIYILNLAMADLLYLLTIPFVVCTHFLQGWHFGAVGCHVLISLDFLTMHASIFTLTAMSTERYLAVLKPFDTVKRSKSYRKAIAVLVWAASLILTLPMMIEIKLMAVGSKRMCQTTLDPLSYKIYISILFCSSIVAPGVIIGYLYVRLARKYWISQTEAFKQTKRLPNQKVLYLILTIVLLFWACFLPFWVWQLLGEFYPDMDLSTTTKRVINYVTTCLTYSNSCINPFLYTLLTKNYKDYLHKRHRTWSAGPYFSHRGCFQRPPRPRRSLSTSSHQGTESFALASTSSRTHNNNEL